MRFVSRKMKLLAAAALLGSTALGGGALANEDTATFTASGTTQAAISVACGANLRFGTIGVHSGNAAATITVDASSGATATSSSDVDAYPATGDSGPGECTVSDETDGDATASLSAPTGTFAGTTLSGVDLSDGGTETLSADVELNKASGIANETLFIGGTLSIPATHTAFATYTETITITVSD